MSGLTATAADASSGLITVVSASSPASSVGSLSIELESTTPIVPSSISAQLSSGGSNVLTVSDFNLTAGSNTGGTVTTWTVATPITVAQLPLGTYTIGVSASDTGGDTANVSDAGTLAFLVQPTITLAASPSAVSYGQTLTFSGTVMGLFPDGTEQPVADQPVSITPRIGATTDSGGQFTVSVQAGPATLGSVTSSDSFDAEIDTPTVARGFSNSASITIIQDPVQFTAQLSSDAVSYGTPVTVRGEIRFESGNTWLPFAGATIGVSNDMKDVFPGSTKDFAVNVSAAADASGDFTVALPVTGPELFTAGYDDQTPGDPWFSQPAAFKLPMSVVLPDGLSGLKATLTPTGGVSVAACLDIANPAATANYVNPVSLIPDVPNVQFQYASSPTGLWKTLISAAPTAAGANSDGTAECYSGRATAPGTSDYYRAETDGSVNFQPATSSVVKASIDPTRFSRFTAAPSRLKAGHFVTVAGQLQQRASGWRSLARQKVQVIFRANGSKTWTVLRVLTTRASGGFSARIKIRHDGTLSARYLGSHADLQCSARRIRIHIRK
jgi:hypothetical protein